MAEPPRLEELVDFPAPFTFRIVAKHSSSLRDRCQQLVEQTLGRPAEDVREQPSKKGAFVSIRVAVTVENAEEIRSVYQALQSVEGLQLLL